MRRTVITTLGGTMTSVPTVHCDVFVGAMLACSGRTTTDIVHTLCIVELKNSILDVDKFVHECRVKMHQLISHCV
jgi:hypothetical protein